MVGTAAQYVGIGTVTNNAPVTNSNLWIPADGIA